MKYALILLTTFIFLQPFGQAAKKRQYGVTFHYSPVVNQVMMMDQMACVDQAFCLEGMVEEGDLKGKAFLERYLKFRQEILAKRKKGRAEELFSSYDYAMNDFLYRKSLEAKTLNELLFLLKGKIADADIQFLKDLFAFFGPKLKVMLKESEIFSSKADILKKSYKKDKGERVIKKLQRFLKLPSRQHYPIYLIWGQQGKAAEVRFNEGSLFLFYNPVTQAQEVNLPGVMAPLAEWMVVQMEVAKKSTYSQQFKKFCALGPKVKWVHQIQRPIAVVWGKMTFAYERDRKKFDSMAQWSSHPWVNTFSKLLYPLTVKTVKDRQDIGGDYLYRAGQLCGEVAALSKLLAQ